MSTNRWLRVLPPLALLIVAPSAAQTTGSIVGRVTSDAGGVLAGVAVEARSPSLQGSRATVTDSTGTYRLALLPPGTYSITLTLVGFAPETREGVTVSLGKDTTLDVALTSKFHEEITVTGETPPVDVTSSGLGTNLDSRTLTTLPTGRNYSSIVQVAPGTSSDANPENAGQSTVTVYGSAGNENTYLIDGVNTSGVEYGFQGKELNYEFIQEVEVKTGGYEAEHGRSTGGIINVITKSGGNEFHGDVFGYYDNDSLQSGANPVVSTGGTLVGFTKQDFGAALGGYILKDKLWYFVAYDRVDNTVTSNLPAGPQAGQSVDSKSKRDLGAAKLTWTLSPNHSLIFSYFQDPRKDTGAINDANHTLNGVPLTYSGRQGFGGRDAAVRYQGVLGPRWIVSAQLARHKEENSVAPASGAGDVIEYRCADPGLDPLVPGCDPAGNFFQFGGFGLVQNKQFTRDFVGASATWFLGKHEVKGGLELEKQEADVVKRMSGGQQVDIFANSVNPSKPIYRHFYWTTPTATVGSAPISQLLASPRHEITTVYLQDRWSILPNLRLNFGVRTDRQEIIDAAGVRQIVFDKDYAPRVGLSWDPTKDGKTRVFGSYGRFYEQIPMDLVIRSFSYERQPRIVNYDPVSTTPDPAAESDFGTPSAILGGFTEPSDPDIRGQYIRELVVGGEREVAKQVTVGAKWIYRDYRNVVEDFLCMTDGTYCIGNPGRGIMQRIFTLDYSQTFPAPRPKRIFRGVQLDATKRFSNRWQGLASYLWSKLDGNYDGEYAPFTNVGADPNISAAWDYYDFFTNGSDLTRITNDGPLSNDRRHQFKVSGVYVAPFDLQVGLAAYYRTGTPVSRYGYSDAYGRYEFFLTERGSEGRTPSTYEADVHLGYPTKVKGGVTLNILLDVFNVLNAQKAILLDGRWGFRETDNASPTPVNPGYGQPVLRTPPRSFRLGLRVSF